jgi:hypothetical protein
MKTFGREELIAFLRQIDEQLEEPVAMEIIGGAAALLGRGSGLLPPKPRLRGVSLRVMDKSKATPWKCQGPTATPRRDPSGLSHGSGRIASPAQRERPPTSASAGEGPRAPNAVPVLEALSPLTRRAARADLSPLRGARQYGRWRGRWEGSMESAEQVWTPSPAPLKPGRSGPSLPMKDKSKATPWKC